MAKPGHVMVRTTMTPWKEQEVPEREVANLKALGILYEGNATTDEGAAKAVERAQAQKVEG